MRDEVKQSLEHEETPEEARKRKLDESLRKQKRDLDKAHENGYNPITGNKALGKPGTYDSVPKSLWQIMSNMDMLTDYVRGEGKYKSIPAGNRFDNLRVMFPEANWTLSWDRKTGKGTITIANGPKELFSAVPKLENVGGESYGNLDANGRTVQGNLGKGRQKQGKVEQKVRQDAGRGEEDLRQLSAKAPRARPHGTKIHKTLA